MKLLLVLSALLASLTGVNPAARAQAVPVEQVVAAVRSVTAVRVASRPANDERVDVPVARVVTPVPVVITPLGERRLL